MTTAPNSLRPRSSISYLVLLTSLLGSCHDASRKAAPVAQTAIPAPIARPVTVAAQVGPAWHWVSPLPQGNALRAVVANDACGVVAVGDESTVMRSLDNGASWTIQQSDDRWRFKSAALMGTDLYVAGDSSNGGVIAKITDCGDGQQKTLRKIDSKVDGSINALAADSTGHVYATVVSHSRGKILCSGDRGTTFTVCDDQPKSPFYGLFIDKAGRVFVAGGYGAPNGGIARMTSDHGATWRTTGQHLGSIGYGIWGDPEGRRLFVTGSSTLSTSTDGGATWSTIDSLAAGGGSMALGPDDAPYIPNDFDKFIYGSAETGTFFLTGGGVARGEGFKSATKPDWNEASREPSFEAAVATKGGHWIGVGSTGHITRSSDDGKTWTSATKDLLPDGDQIVDIRSDGLTTYMLRRARFLRSDDGGRTFTPLGKETLPDITVSTRDYPTFAADHAALLLPRPAKNAVARSTDRGDTFKEIPLRAGAGQSVLHVWGGISGVFYASGTGGALFRSRDEGATFTPVAIATKADLAAGAVSDHDVFLVGISRDAGTGQAFHSGNDGRTWSSTTLDFEPFGIGVSGATAYVIGRYGRVARSSNKGQTWTKTVDLDCGDVGGFVVGDARIDVACGSGRLYTSTDDGVTFTMRPMPADVELLVGDAHGGLYAAGDRFPQLLHYF